MRTSIPKIRNIKMKQANVFALVPQERGSKCADFLRHTLIEHSNTMESVAIVYLSKEGKVYCGWQSEEIERNAAQIAGAIAALEQCFHNDWEDS